VTALSGCYITAELTNSFFSNGDSQVFEIGDGETYGGYRNKHQGVTVKLSVGHWLKSHLWTSYVTFLV